MIFQHDDVIEQGATFYRSVIWYQDAAKTVPFDLSGKTLRSLLLDKSTGEVLATFAFAVTDADAGEFVWSLPAANSLDLTPGKAATATYRIDAVDDSDPTVIIPCQRGSIIIREGRTVEPTE